MTIRNTLTAAAIAGALAVTLVGCGTTEAPADADAASAGEEITLTDARGVEVTLDGPATKVVGTEWNVIENLVSLGVTPVGAADIAGYDAWVSAATEPLDDSVTDIGTRGEPSIDTVASLGADLIVATSDLPEAAVAQLEEIAPVLVVTSADASRQIEQMTDNLELIAQATGTEDEAERVVSDFEKTIDDGAAALADAGLDGARVGFTDGWIADGQVSFRPFVDGSLIGDVNTELGLVSPWELEGDAAYGLASTDVEGLTTVDADAIAYIANEVDGEVDFVESLADNAVWASLPFVQDEQVHRLDDGIWMFGGPASMTRYVDSLVSALTE